MRNENLVVLVTASDTEAALALGQTLVEEGLAACVQLIPGGTAIYRWQGELYTESQNQLLIKTREGIWPQLQARIVALHDDEVPEILALPVAHGLPAYLSWLAVQTTIETPTPRTASTPDPQASWRDYAEIHPAGAQATTGTVKMWQDLYSPQLHNQRDILVHLPPSYAVGERRYPVLYMHDGQNLFDETTSYAGKWRVDETMSELAAEGIEAIVVGSPNAGEQRSREYIPFPDPHTTPVAGDAYAAFIVETVKPLIDRDFRTLPDRTHTGIAGSSLGGLISLYAFFRYPKVFGLAGAFSPAFGAGCELIYPFVRNAPIAPGRIYIDAGTREVVGGPMGKGITEAEGKALARHYLQSVRRMRDLLGRKGYRKEADLLYVEDKGGTHHESAWAARLPDALRFLLRDLERS